MAAKDPVIGTNEENVHTPRPSSPATLETCDAILKAQAEAYNNEGEKEFIKKEYQKAIFQYTEGITIKCGDKELNAKLYSNRATVYYCLGNYNKALDDVKAALQFESIYMKALTTGVEACLKLSLYEQAISWCNLGLSIEQENQKLTTLKNEAVTKQSKLLEAKITEKKDTMTGKREDFLRPMEFSPVNQTVSDKRKSGLQYLSLGDDYSKLSDFEKAIHYYKQYLAICKELKDRAAEGHAYSKLGKAYNSVGNTVEAKKFYELQLSNAISVGDKVKEGEALRSLGNLFLCIRKYKQAIENHDRHLKITKDLGDRAGEGRAYGNLGNSFYGFGWFEKAMEYYEKHFKIIKEIGDRNEEGKAYGNLGRVHRSLGNFAEAIEYHGEQLRIAKEEERKADEACAYYELGRDLESLDCSTEALQFYKLSKKLFYEIRADLQCKQTSPFKDEWKINLFEVFHCVHTSLRRTYLKLNMDVEALFAVEDGRAQALEDILGSRYGKNSAQLRSSGEGTAMSDISKYISANTIVLELDDDRINIWFLLPGQSGQDVQVIRKSKEGYAQFETEMFNMKRTRSADDISPEQILNETDKNLIEVRDLESDSRFLYDFIFGAVADLVQGEELVIVPHGPLCFFPFALLQQPNSKYLCESFRIRVLPSLTSMKMIADCPRGYHCKSGALLVGDPLVGKIFYRGKLKNIMPLPYAREEVKTIGRITNIKPLIGEQATKTKVLQQLNSVAFVHIAAHGNAERGGILLAPIPKRTSQLPEEKDCMLTMAEVQNVKLRARLVVLSTCHSGRGEVNSEGVIGIARAFLAAGARSVLVSLWAIDDEATMLFMRSFYQHLVRGRTASEALKKAMECHIKSERFNHPRQWAPFVLLGDDVMLEFPERKLESCITTGTDRAEEYSSNSLI